MAGFRVSRDRFAIHADRHRRGALAAQVPGTVRPLRAPGDLAPSVRQAGIIPRTVSPNPRG